MDTLNIAVIPGDGIGPEVVAQGLRVLDAVSAGSSVEVRTTTFDLGARHYRETGEILDDSTLERLDTFDAILLGAVGDPSITSGILERGLLLKLRFGLDQYVNLRPSRSYPGVATPLKDPGAIDFVVVREGTEGPYIGNGGTLRHGTIHEVATEVSLNTAFGVQRVVRFGFEQAQKRRRHVTLVHKHNVLVHAGGLWARVVEEVASEYPEVEYDYLHVDAATIKMVSDPEFFDVILTDNIFGDILTDLAGAVTGGIGLASSGNINPERAHPSMFEPVHGSAPDIAGQGVADPTATVASVAMMLDFLGMTQEAERIQSAVVRVMDQRAQAGDSVTWTTESIGQALVDQLA